MTNKILHSNRFSLSGRSLLQQKETEQHLSAPETEKEHTPPQQHQFSTGHILSLDIAENTLEIHTPEGAPAVHISLKEDGPVVEVAGARLSLKSPKDIDVQCQNFSVNTEEDIYMNSNGGLIIESTQELQLNCEVDVHIRAKVIWLN